ncbi:MFS transporter [Curvibacter sp. CHRR-16]|nr:MFS transporter [Curvibacter sp. CHRR-16]
MVGLCCVLIMVALDQTIVGTALPTIVTELQGFELYAWVGTSYLLTSVITVPIFGKLGDEHGRKPFLLISITLFTLASLLCGAAQSMPQLVAARALQGIGGGMLTASVFASVADIFPNSQERLRWQVVFSSSYGLASAIGPSLGGYLSHYWGWRWVFLVNLPVGILGLYFVWRHLPRVRHQHSQPQALDWWGAALVAVALGGFQLLVEWLPEGHNPLVLVLLALLSTGAAVALWRWERRIPNPMLPLDMLLRKPLSQLMLLANLLGLCMFGVIFYTPLLLQSGFGLSPHDAGLLVTPLAVCITIGSMVNGQVVRLLPQLSSNTLLLCGLWPTMGMAVSLMTMQATTPHWWIVITMVLGGLGLGLLLPNITLLVQYTSPRSQLGIATAMLQTVRMVGGMLGTALMGTWISYHTQTHNTPATLVNANHQGFGFLLAVLVLCLLLVRALPPLSLHDKPHDPVPATD